MATSQNCNGGPNLTCQKLRRNLCSYPPRYHFDPYFGVPEGDPLMVLDPVTGYIRPLISYTAASLAGALANAVGHTNEYFRPNDQCNGLRIATCGIIEMKLVTPGPVAVGDEFNPAVVGGLISADYVEPAVGGYYKVVEAGGCEQCCKQESCPDAFPAPVDVSPTAALVGKNQRTVMLRFGDCC